MGVAVIGLKYRTRPPHILPNEGIQALTLLDAKRAMRLVRHRAAEWGLDQTKIGVAGYSAGANLAMNLAANFDLGDPQSTDPIERLSSRPDFAVGLGTWHWRKPENPFVFKPNSPPVFLVHATTDKPVEIATNIIAQAIIALLAREQHNITKSSNFPTLVATNISEQCHKDSEIYHQAYLLRIDWAKKLYNIVIILILFKFLLLLKNFIENSV